MASAHATGRARNGSRVRFTNRSQRLALLGLVLFFTSSFGLLGYLKSKKDAHLIAQEAAEAPTDASGRGSFLRPSVLEAGSTHEVHVDATEGAFTDDTIVELSGMDVAVISKSIRHDMGLTLQLAVARKPKDGVVDLRLRTPTSDGGEHLVEETIYLEDRKAPGPIVVVDNLPRSENLQVEGSFVHFELTLRGAGPFYVEYGLRNKSYWVGRAWNCVQREYAKEQNLVVDEAETESFSIPLPEELNIVDVVAIDRNGRETFQSFVVGSASPYPFEETKKVGLLDNLLGTKTAWGSSNSNPSFGFASPPYYCMGEGGSSYQCMDSDGSVPLEFTASTCQGVTCGGCTTCPDGTLDSASVGTAGGGYEGRPDGYSAPTGMMRARGRVMTHSGEYIYSVVDMSIPVPGLDFSIRRTYRSQIKYHSRLGRNWDMNIFSRYLRFGTATGTSATAGDLYFYGGDGRRDFYDHTTGSNYTSPDGFYDKLKFTSSSTSQEIRKKDGSRWVYSETQYPSLNVVRGRLSYIYGRQAGNYLQFHYDTNDQLTKISSSTGIDLILTYSGDYLKTIHQEEDTSHKVEYYRDGSHGTLSKVEYAADSVWDWVNGSLTEYEDTKRTLAYDYNTTATGDQKYNLTKVYDGRGNTANAKEYALIEITYETSVDKVEEIQADPDDVGEQWNDTKLEFTYDTAPGGDPRTTTTVRGYNSAATPTSGVLRKIVKTFDSSKGGMLSREIQDASGNTIAEWTYERNCTCNSITKIVDPLGRVEYRGYDIYGNLTLRRLAGDDSTATDYRDDIITLYRYDDPNYVNPFKFGGMLEMAKPEVVSEYITTSSSPIPNIATTIAAGKKTRRTYDLQGDLTKIQPPEFKYASEFGDATAHQPSVEYTHDYYGLVVTEIVKLDATQLRKRKYEYHTTGNEKNLVKKIIDDPDTGGLQITKEYGYNARRDLTSFTDPRGNATTFVWSENRLLEEIEPPAPSGQAADYEIRFRHDANNNVVGSDVGGNATTERFETHFTRDLFNEQVEVEHEVSASKSLTVTYEYDGIRRVRKIAEAGGKTTRIEHDFANIDSAWHARTRAYVSGTGFSEVELSESLIEASIQKYRARRHIDFSKYTSTWFTYDDYGRRELTVTSPDREDLTGGDPSDVFYASKVTLNKDGEFTTLERGEATNPGSPLSTTAYIYKYGERHDYDELGRQVRSSYYESHSDFSSDVNPMVHLQKRSFDGRVEITRQELNAGDSDTVYAYDDASRLERIDHSDGNSYTELDLDGNGNIEWLRSFEYDPVAAATTEYKVSRTYDVLDRMTEESYLGDTSGTSTEDLTRAFDYDFRGNVNKITDDYTGANEDIEHTITYDGLNRIEKAIYASGETTEIINEAVFDEANRKITLKDGKSQGTVYELHPALDVVDTITYAADDPTARDNKHIAYDRAGRPTKIEYASASAPTGTWDIEVEYDLLDRIEKRTIDGSTTGQETEAEFVYDYQNRLLEARSKVSGVAGFATEVLRTYNSLFMLEETQQKFGETGTFLVKSTSGSNSGWEMEGRTRLTYENDTGLSATRTLTYDYDDSGRLEKIHSGSQLAKYTYAGASSRVVGLDLSKPGTGTTKLAKSVDYDHLLRPTANHYQDETAGTVRKYVESWGSGSDSSEPTLTRKTFKKDGVTSLVTYAYDEIGRLDSEKVGAAAAVSRAYDDANNRTGLGSATISANASNELTSGTGPTITFSHDARGNLTGKDRAAATGVDQSFEYDKLNRLTEYDESGSFDEWTYSYDALGRRVKKENADEARFYFYDGFRCIVEVVEPNGGSAYAKEYVYGNGVDEVLLEWLPDGGSQKPFWPLIDSLGTVRDLADLDGVDSARVRVAYDYDADGNLIGETFTGSGGTVEQDVLFTGRWLDRETVNADSDGLYYYRARQYDPEIARFLQRDPIGVWGDSLGLGNGYSYVAGNAPNATDPSGMLANFLFSAALGAVTGAVGAWLGGGDGASILVGAVFGALGSGVGNLVFRALQAAGAPGLIAGIGSGFATGSLTSMPNWWLRDKGRGKARVNVNMMFSVGAASFAGVTGVGDVSVAALATIAGVGAEKLFVDAGMAHALGGGGRGPRGGPGGGPIDQSIKGCRLLSSTTECEGGPTPGGKTCLYQCGIVSKYRCKGGRIVQKREHLTSWGIPKDDCEDCPSVEEERERKGI